MRPVLTADEMRAADRATIEQVGLPGVVLMENAGAAVADEVARRFPAVRRPVFVCGRGNNGGDGFVAARRLLRLSPTAVLTGRREEVKGDARTHLQAYEQSGGALLEVRDSSGWAGAFDAFTGAGVVVDAVLGTGLREKPTGLAAEAIDLIGKGAARGLPVVAVDLPSGVPSDSGDVPWPAVTAVATVTFAALKAGHVLAPACDHAGEIRVADIGIPERVLAASGHALWLLEAADAAAFYPPRPREGHKGSFGHVLVIAGCVGKTGAAILAARSALRAGAGLVTVTSAQPALATIAGGAPELMTESLAATPNGGIDAAALDRALDLAEARDAVVLGPGLGSDERTREFVRAFAARCPRPLLIDADGLNAIGEAAAPPAARLAEAWAGRPVVLTPHPGEMARLAGRSTGEVQAARLAVVRDVARRLGAVTVLKGRRTLVADPAGRVAVNPTGNPGMATAGTGDVLAGLGGVLLAGHDPWLAAGAAVFLHGRAGDLAAARVGEAGLVASDLVDALPAAVAAVQREASRP